MLKKIIAALALLAACVLPSAIVAPPANAGYFNDVYHAEDDSGYNEAIHIMCEDGRHFWLSLGQNSPARCGFHVARVIARTDQHVRMFNTLPPYQTINVWPGWSVNVPSGGSFRMYMQRPY